MKFSVKMMLMIIAMVSTMTLVNAQSKEGKEKGKNLEEQVAKKTARLQEELGLNDAQTKKVSAINLAYAQKSKSVREMARASKEAGKEVDKEATKAQIKEIKTAQIADIKTVLTPTQLIKFDELIASHQANKKGKGQKGGKEKKVSVEERVEKKTAHLQETLGLNDTQATKVKAINLAYAQKTESLREAARTSKEAGKEVDKEAMKGQLKTMKTAQMTEIKAVLTAAQITKFDAMVEEQKAKKAKAKGKGDKQ